MGTDNGEKASFWMRLPSKRSIKLIVLACGGVLAVVSLLMSVLPAPEVIMFDSFPSAEVVSEGSIVPRRCQSMYKRVSACQDSSQPTLLLTCHRTWCKSFGHCSACAGIGDRFHNHVLTILHRALEPRHSIEVGQQKIGNPISSTEADCSLKVEFDHPVSGISLLRSTIYKDPYGWAAQLFRFRSYDVKRKQIGANLWKNATMHGSPIVQAHFNAPIAWRNLDKSRSFPLYDPCIFWSYFRPSPAMERDIHSHQQRIRKDPSTAIIGVHFRTGDAWSFQDLNIPEDSRLQKGLTVEQAWEKMKSCVEEFGDNYLNSHSEFSRVKYLLATDHQRVKDMAREDNNFYTTNVHPANFRQAPDQDRSAWLEIFLLSQQDAFVMNELADKSGYHGKAGAISAFALLVQQIGFFSDENVKKCQV